MKKITLLAFAMLSTLAFGEELLYRPTGTYSYSREVVLTKKRTAETLNHITTEGQARIKELKKTGFTCIRKSQKESICQKTETDFPSTPDFIQNAVDDYLKKAQFSFAGTGEPTIVFDGANTEWLVYEDVYLGSKKINVYRITKTPDGWFLSFPVSEDQGIGNMNLESNNRLGLPLTMQTKENGQTVGYFIKAIFLN